MLLLFQLVLSGPWSRYSLILYTQHLLLHSGNFCALKTEVSIATEMLLSTMQQESTPSLVDFVSITHK
jgi:hypothetical protein